MWTLTPTPVTPCHGRPHNVELWIHNVTAARRKPQAVPRRQPPGGEDFLTALVRLSTAYGLRLAAVLDIDADFVVAVGRAGLSGQEQHPGAPGREPAGQELGGARGTERLTE